MCNKTAVDGKIGSGTTASKTKDSKFYYLTEDAREKLKIYEYRGCDNSLLYNYVLSPLATFLVNNVVPESLAPNSITFFGFLLMVSSYVAHWWYVPNLDVTEKGGDDYPPRWIFLWHAIAFLIYQTLDNMDGKQARKTKSGSPLGLLFDHGCDAINSILGAVNLMIGLSLIPSEDFLQIWIILIGPLCVFYVSTWDQYHTGEMNLGIFNAPNEGIALIVMQTLVSFWNGPEYWRQTDMFDSLLSISWFKDLVGDIQIRNNDLVAIFILLLCLREVFLNCTILFIKYKGSAESLFPMFVLALCTFVIGFVDPNIWVSVPRSGMHLCMALFAEFTTELMLAHTTAQKFLPWRWQLSPLIGMTCWVVAFGNSEGLQYSIIAYAVFMNAYLVMKLSTVVHELCEVLGVWCFDIVTPHYSVKKL